MKNSVKRLATGAVIIALIFTVTWSFRVPIPATNGGYINLGDVIIYITAFAVGGPEVVIGAAVGSALADLLGGAMVYILPTFFIKGLMAAISLLFISRKKTAVRYILACLTGGAIMTAGYGIYEYFFFGFAYAAGSLPLNMLQWLGGTVIAAVLYPAVKHLSSVIRNK
jgi:uncharacterized membrane protein